MSRNEAPLKQRANDAPKSSDGSFSSLSKTLEDLEQRLSRLSSVKPPMVDATPEIEEAAAMQASASERLRAVAEARRAARRPALSAAVSSVAVERHLAEAGGASANHRAAARAAAAERRMGAIAAEVEQLQLQNTSIAMIKDLAAELSELRGDIQGRLSEGTEQRIGELQNSFAELKQMVEGREGPDRINAEIFEIMEALTELTAGTADQSSLDALRSELDSVSALVAQMAREESLEAVQLRWDAFEAQIADRVELDLQAKRDLKVELERLRGSLRSLATEDQVLDVRQRWEEFEARYFETSRVQTEESVAKVLRTELDGLREKLDAIVAENGAAALDARFEALVERLDPRELGASVERLAERMGEIESALVGLPEILQIDQMEQRIQALADGVETLAREIREPDLSHLELIEDRLDEISVALTAATTRAAAQIDMAPVERIEARVADLAGRVDRLAANEDVELLSLQIAALAERVEDIGAGSVHEDLGKRIDTLSERVEVLFKSAGAPDTSAFEARLTALAQRLETSASARGVDPDVIAALEAQIARMTELLAGMPGFGSDDGEAVASRLEAIERRLDENRDNVIAAARAAAEEAVRRMQEEEPRLETDFVRELAQDLRNLEALGRESDERTFGIFDAVHATLLKIVERLTTIETELRDRDADAAPRAKPAVVSAPVLVTREPAPMVEPIAETSSVSEEEPKGLRGALQRHKARRAARHAEQDAAPSLAERIRPTPIVEATEAPIASAEPVSPAVLEAPALDAADSLVTREANRPLEPGSGAPDIAALIERVRQQQRGEQSATEPMGKADFIAAARKAAMAAAAEAQALREREEGGEDRTKTSSNRRKPILMGVGAVLLALMAVPLGIDYLAPNGSDAGAPAALTDAMDAPLTMEPATVAALDAPPVDRTAPVPSGGEASNVEAAASTQPTAASEPVTQATTMPAVEPGVSADLATPTIGTVAPSEPAAVDQSVADAAPATQSPAPVAPALAATEAQTADAGLSGDETAMLLASARAHLSQAALGPVPSLPEGTASEALTKAVADQNPMAFFEVGLRLMEGRTGPSDPTAALNWFAQSATRGFAPAQYSLGTLFEKGNGVERNASAARDWYRLAAEQGNVRAMHNLAVLYATGIDGKSEPETAAEWFTRAADHGMRDSQYNLGILYARGAGVEQDLASSYRWFGIVGRAGDKDAEGKMEEVGKTLSVEQRQALDAEIAAWAPQPRIEAVNTVDVPAEWASASGRTASIDMTRAIRNVQAILIKLGYNPGQPDGVAGAQTEAAIREFQGKAGLQATGKIDEPLIRALLERKDA